MIPNHRYYAPLRLPLPISARFTCRWLNGYLAYSRLFVSLPIYYYRGRLVVLPRSNGNITPGLLVSRYTSASGYLYKETGGSPKFPSYPYEYMPRS